MERRDKPVDIDPADGTEDRVLGSHIAEAALERWELLDRVQGKRKRPRERQN
jgi:hypothetical protein